MASNIDKLKEGTFIRFENGRAVEGRQVFQRIYPAGLAGLAAFVTDATLPQIGDAYDDAYPTLKLVDIDISVKSADATGQNIVHVKCDYVDQGTAHVEGGASTATVLTSFDVDGNRIEVEHNGDSYVAQVPFEEPRRWIQIQIAQTFEGSQADSGINAHVESTLNKVNADTFQNMPPRCWRVAKIDHELMRDWFQGVQKKTYMVRYYLESRPVKVVELTPGGGTTNVAGWDTVIGYEADGAIPADAVFRVIELYGAIDFGGSGGVFGSVVF